MYNRQVYNVSYIYMMQRIFQFMKRSGELSSHTVKTVILYLYFTQSMQFIYNLKQAASFWVIQ